MKRGEKVIVVAFGNKELERIVWEDAGSGVLVCTEEGFQQATKRGDEPVCVGFPASDVHRKPMGAATPEKAKRRVG